MKYYLLRVIKPEIWITTIFILLISGIAVIVGLDFIQKKRINETLNNAKIVMAEVALNLSSENIGKAVTVSPQFLKSKGDQISSITIYPDNNIKIIFNEIFSNNINGEFVFHFDSFDSLARGNVTCLSGNVLPTILPVQCRK